MEEYEEFCKKHLARIQGEAIKEESFTPAHQGVSLIQFHGVAVLSPLLSFERKKEMQQYRQKAIELEVGKQDTRKKTALLNRVHEILDNVQVRKVPCLSDLHVEDAENTHQSSESRVMNGFAILPNIISLPAFTAQRGPTKLEKTLEGLSLDTDGCLKSATTKSLTSSEESISPKQSDSPDTTQLENQGHTNVVNSNALSLTLIPNEKEETDAPEAVQEAPDPYVMSLQNLLKKSKEYIEREQSRRSMRSNAKRVVNESHSDKENDAIKISDSLKEKVKCMHRSRSCSPVAFDKPVMNKSNMLLQGAQTQMHTINGVGLSSFSKAAIPARSGTSSALDTESDEDLKSNYTVDYESSLVKSLTGSYAKLPSPEPSLSPKMHRRRPRTSSMGHIVINNPVNAWELSPLDKSKIMGNALPDITKNITICEPMSNFAIDENGVCISKGQVLDKHTCETFDASNLVKPNHMCKQETNLLENNVCVTTAKEIAESATESHIRVHSCTLPSKLHNPYAAIQSPETMNLLTVNEVKPNSLPEKAKRCSPVELNKSYDVDTPSPMLLQSHSSQQPVDTPDASEPFLESSLENRVKRRLDLDMDSESAHKENNPFAALTVGISEQEKRWQHDQKCDFRVGSGYSSKSEVLTNTSLEEDILKKKMLAFEEMRKRLEEQHAQQLSLLIAEQEKEQESLQKEIEEQERRLKDKKSDVADSPEPHMNNGIGVDWRQINESDLLELRWTQMETCHSAVHLRSGSGSTNSLRGSVSTADSPFYLRGSTTSATSAPKSVGRGKTRWSQVFSQNMQNKLNKVTALAKGFLTRRLMETDKLKQLRKTVKDTAEFMKMFRSEVPLKRGALSAQDASLHERVLAQLQAALFEIHDIFFVMDASERMSILHHDREILREKLIRQMEKVKSPRERVSLSAATQKSLDRKKLLKAVEMGMPNKKTVFKPKTSETRILQPNQGQNAPVNRLLCRQGTFKTSEKGVEQSRMKPSESRVPNKVISGVYAERTQRKKPNAVTT